VPVKSIKQILQAHIIREKNKLDERRIISVAGGPRLISRRTWEKK